MYAIRKIFEQGQIFGLKFYFRPHRITRSDRCIETVLCKVWGSCPGYKKPRPWCFPPCLCISLCQQRPWHQSPGCVRFPLILLSNLHGHLSPFTYSCKPLTIIHHMGLGRLFWSFFFQWSKKGAMNYVLFTASGGVLDIFIGLLQRSKFVFVIPIRTCTMRRMQLTHLCLVFNS